MQTNFQIIELIHVQVDNVLYDLHNNFHFIGFEHLTDNKELILRWRKGTGDWVPEDAPQGITILHKNVSFINISYESQQWREDDKCLGEMTFYPSSSRDVNDQLLLQETPKEDDDLIYTFESGTIIRVGCESSLFTLD